jgi:hypothetical protein
MNKNIKWANKELPTISHDELLKYDSQLLGRMDGGITSYINKTGWHNPEFHKKRDAIWSAERMRQTEEEYPIQTILEAHSNCKTLTDVLEYLKIGHVSTYFRLCEVYEIKPLKYDKTTKNGGPSTPILVYRLIEIPCEIYGSKKEAQRNIFPSDKKIGLRIREGELNYDKKIDYQTDKEGRKIRAKLTGKQTQIGNRTPSNEIQIYELVEEFVGEFPSREEVYRQLGDLAIQSQLNGKIYQSKGYRFYELN